MATIVKCCGVDNKRFKKPREYGIENDFLSISLIAEISDKPANLKVISSTITNITIYSSHWTYLCILANEN